MAALRGLLSCNWTEAAGIYKKVFIDKKKQEPQADDQLKYRRGSACCCLTLLLALPSTSRPGKSCGLITPKVALAARPCAPQREQASLLSLCFAWCQCVRGVLFFSPPLDLPSPTGKRGWVKLGMGEGSPHTHFPSFPNPGNRLLASVSEMLLFHVTGLQSLLMCVWGVIPCPLAPGVFWLC